MAGQTTAAEWTCSGFDHVALLDDSDWDLVGIVANARRPETGGRWTEGGTVCGGSADISECLQSAKSSGKLVLVEVTEAEADSIRAGRPVQAVTRRMERARAAGRLSNGRLDDWGVPARNRVSNRGRYASGTTTGTRAAPIAAPVIEMPDPIMRPSGIPYFPRILSGGIDVVVVRKEHEDGGSVFLYGPPGTGKTALLEAAFPDHEIVQGTGDTEVSDFLGQYIPMPDGSFKWTDGPLLRAMARGVALIVDEIALIDPKVLAVIYSPTDGRGEVPVFTDKGHEIRKAAPGFGVHSACNPMAPGAIMSEALLSRQDLQIEYPSDYDLCRARFAPEAVVTFAENMDARRLEGEVSWSPQTRELVAFGRIMRLHGEEMALSNLLSCCPPIDRPIAEEALALCIGRRIESLRIGR